ncbi:lipoprotein LpqH [Mycolicibacterium arenosum]|uniref:Lipoprotein LpqH n=1 Tax=Mycolicibacterium arenosum TaxID=2952157 RepID=A0ABT1MAN2_9MYCO|nr:lipoprotein LpqH [Mycolicibacterium sp. CAU 1645]MCP9275902.1 lipoprotein LpqH [Mycolicibacterium sp. CAU 1645]
MKRGLLVAVSGAAMLIAGLSGCSSSADKPEASSSSSSSSSSESSSASSSASESAEASSGATKLTIDGADKGITGSPTCTTMGDTVAIAIGQGTTGIAATVSAGDAPTVSTVALGNVDGAMLAVGAGAGDATATKDGNTYTIKGNATGADMSNPMAGIITKPFELVVACP